MYFVICVCVIVVGFVVALLIITNFLKRFKSVSSKIEATLGKIKFLADFSGTNSKS